MTPSYQTVLSFWDSRLKTKMAVVAQHKVAQTCAKLEIWSGAIPRLRLLTSKSQGTQPIPRDLYEKHGAAKHLFDQYLSQIQVAGRQDENEQHWKHDTCNEGVDLYPYSSTVILCIFCFAWATSYKLNTSMLTPFAFFTSFFLITSHKVMSRTKRTKSVSVAPLRQNLGQSLVLPSPPQVLQSNECA